MCVCVYIYKEVERSSWKRGQSLVYYKEEFHSSTFWKQEHMASGISEFLVPKDSQVMSTMMCKQKMVAFAFSVH